MPAIKAKVPRRASPYVYLRDSVVETEKSIRANLERTTRTWRRPVTFKSQILNSKDTYRVRVWTDDPLWNEINEGTPALYVILSRDFDPKTRPYVLDSFPGRGGRVGTSRTPRPGIIARHWDIAAQQKEGPSMQQRLQDAIARMVAVIL